MYRHTQIGTVILASIGTFVAISAGLLFALPSEVRSAMVAATGAALILLLLFAWLTVEVDATTIRIRFGLGLIRRTIPLARVRGAEAVPTKWWYGFGIRLTPIGWMWNVSGLRAVKLTYEDGGNFLIGTDDPEGLERAIRTALDRST